MHACLGLRGCVCITRDVRDVRAPLAGAPARGAAPAGRRSSLADGPATPTSDTDEEASEVGVAGEGAVTGANTVAGAGMGAGAGAESIWGSGGALSEMLARWADRGVALGGWVTISAAAAALASAAEAGAVEMIACCRDVSPSPIWRGWLSSTDSSVPTRVVVVVLLCCGVQSTGR